MSDYMTSQYADHMMETLKHWQAHLAGDTVTDYCDRECPKCELLDDDGEFTPDFLFLEAMKPVECDSAEPGDLHLKVTLAWGGPNTYLFRDWGEDRLETHWGGHEVWYGPAVTDVLDYFAELASC